MVFFVVCREGSIKEKCTFWSKSSNYGFPGVQGTAQFTCDCLHTWKNTCYASFVTPIYCMFGIRILCKHICEYFLIHVSEDWQQNKTTQAHPPITEVLKPQTMERTFSFNLSLFIGFPNCSALCWRVIIFSELHLCWISRKPASQETMYVCVNMSYHCICPGAGLCRLHLRLL